jgi:uncharacterized protein YdhG (YjbR/CyaY superfamily)
VRPKTITEYINGAPKPSRKKLREMRATIRAAAPKAVEAIKWGMPSFVDKKILVIFAAFKRHIGFFPASSTAMRAFKKDLSKFVAGKGSIQFPLDKPLPLRLVRKMTAFRVREIAAKDKK